MRGLDEEPSICYFETLGEDSYAMGHEISHGLESCRAPFEIQLHFEVTPWTLARMCGVRRSDLTADSSGFKSSSSWASISGVRVGPATDSDDAEWHSF